VFLVRVAQLLSVRRHVSVHRVWRVVVRIGLPLLAAVSGFLLFCAFSFGSFGVPFETAGADGVFPIAVVFGIICGAVCVFLMWRLRHSS
jgi:hypothetical protein